MKPLSSTLLSLFIIDEHSGLSLLFGVRRVVGALTDFPLLPSVFLQTTRLCKSHCNMIAMVWYIGVACFSYVRMQAVSAAVLLM